jgi:hypothetical protein
MYVEVNDMVAIYIFSGIGMLTVAALSLYAIVTILEG